MSNHVDLLELAKSLPSPTPEELAWQRLDFAHGQLAASTKHKPNRRAFKSLAIELGIPGSEFDSWAALRDWSGSCGSRMSCGGLCELLVNHRGGCMCPGGCECPA